MVGAFPPSLLFSLLPPAIDRIDIIITGAPLSQFVMHSYDTDETVSSPLSFLFSSEELWLCSSP